MYYRCSNYGMLLSEIYCIRFRFSTKVPSKNFIATLCFCICWPLDTSSSRYHLSRERKKFIHLFVKESWVYFAIFLTSNFFFLHPSVYSFSGWNVQSQQLSSLRCITLESFTEILPNVAHKGTSVKGVGGSGRCCWSLGVILRSRFQESWVVVCATFTFCQSQKMKTAWDARNSGKHTLGMWYEQSDCIPQLDSLLSEIQRRASRLPI